jgi:hypothetical protein
MKITTNVAKFPGQVQMISDVVKGYIGEEVTPTSSIDSGLTLTEVIFGWINWCHKVPAEERISSKRITTKDGAVNLTFNNLNGNVKIQVKTNQVKFVIPGLQA